MPRLRPPEVTHHLNQARRMTARMNWKACFAAMTYRDVTGEDTATLKATQLYARLKKLGYEWRMGENGYYDWLPTQ